MSRLDELLRELCPDGVEQIKIGEVVKYEQPGKYIVESTDYKDEYTTPVLTAGQSFILGYTNEKEGHYPASSTNPVIIFDDFTGAFKWVDFEFKVKSSAMKMLTADEERTSLRYIYHVMGKIAFSSSEHKRLWIGTYSEFMIPLPPLEVQSEIVRILDNFTELTARKKQYEYYKTKVFTSYQYEEVTLGKVLLSIHTGLNPRKFFKLNTDDAENYYVTIREFKDGQLQFTDKTDRINDEALRLCNNRSNLEVGDVLFSGTGTIGEMYVIEEEPTNWNIKEGVYSLKPNPERVLSKYLKYYLSTKPMQDKFEMLAEGGTVKSISMKKMDAMIIQLPSIEDQRKIVAILDRFDILCNDLSAGLPAEIEARQKQYEYYRDKLLTFKELA